MDRDALLDGIVRRAGLESRTEAERAAIATLTTLGEHVSAGQAQQLATTLPPEISDAATSRASASPAAFGTDEFVRRVATREGAGIDEDAAALHVRATMATLAETSAHDALQRAREQLPDEFASLFDTAGLREE